MKVLALNLAMLSAATMLPFAAGAQMSSDANAGMMNSASPMPGTPEINGNATGNPSSSAMGTNTSMRETLGAPGLTGRELRDQEFLRKMTEGDVAQVEFGRLAVQKGSPEVKAFGQKMIQDHTAINTDLSGVADQLGVLVPSKMNKPDKEEYDKLRSLSGDDFDREYILLMVKDHREDLHQLRLEAMNTDNQNLQTELAKAAPVLRQHMQLAMDLAQQKGVPVPPRPQRPGSAPRSAQTPPPSPPPAQ